MKIEKIGLFSVPVIICLLLYYISDMVYFNDYDDSTLAPVKGKKSYYAQQKIDKEKKYEEILNSNLDEYDAIYQQEHTAFVNKIEKQWGEFESPTNTTWVSYVKNDNVKRSVDYKTGDVNVEMLVNQDVRLDKKQSLQLEKQIFKLLNTTDAEAFEEDTVAQNVEARLPNNVTLIFRGSPKDVRLFTFDELTSLDFNQSGYAKVSSKLMNKVKTKERKAKKQGKKILSASFRIKKSVLKKAARYADTVLASSKKQNIPPELIYAIMESESSFNPMAKSHVPAYGLMQIVPRSAGKDATKHLYGRARILAPSYLYSSNNNIKVGTAYLHVLYHNYLRKVKDPKSRMYCAIAAYNTGTTNVARAFIKRKNFSRAVKKINKLSPDEVYRTLTKRLPFKETRDYVKKVTKKMKKYTDMASINDSA